MAWTSMHFAVGMCGGAALTLAPCLILRRGFRFIPVGMTLGGLWALVPDMPRIWREDFTSLPFASTLGTKDFELWLHSIGDIFFLHHSLDAQPKEFALLGLAMIIGLYNLAWLGMLITGRRKRSLGQQPYIDESPGPRVTPKPPHTTQPGPHRHTSTNPVVGRIGADRSA